MPSERASGFTLIELMVAIAVLAILLSLALPSFQQTLRSNRVSSTTNEMLASLALARTEAIKGVGPAGVCPSSNGTSCATGTDWSGGWVVWRQQRTASGVEKAVVRYVQAKGQLAVSGPSDGIQFTSQGRSSATGTGKVGLASSVSGGPARCIELNATGQTRLLREACT